MRTLRWVLVFVVIAIIAGVLGFQGLDGKPAEAAKLIFFLSSTIVGLLIIMALASGPRSREDG